MYILSNKKLNFKNSFSFFLAFTAILISFIALFLPCVYNDAFIAQADSSNYDIILPDSNYVQFVDPVAYFCENGIHYVKDGNRIIVIKDANTINSTAFINAEYAVKSMVVCFNFLIINTGKKFVKINLNDNTSSDLLLENATVDYNLLKCGNYLFAINRISGDTIVYDSTFTKIKNQTVKAFTQCELYSANGYVFSVWIDFNLSTGVHFIVSKTSPDLTTVNLFEISSLNKIYVGNYIYVSSDNALTAYDENGSKVFTAEMQTENSEIYAENDKLNVLNKSEKSIDCFTATKDGLTIEKSVRTSGKNGHFDNINGAIKSGDSIAVVDSNGLYFENNFIETANSDSVCFYKEKICYSSDSNFFITDGTSSTIIDVGCKISDIAACDDFVFILTEDAVYEFDGQNVKPLLNFGGKKIATTKSGNLVYVLNSTTGFKAFTTDGEEAVFPFNEAVDDVIDFDIDYVGNLLIVKNNSAIKYKRSLLQFEKESEIALSKENYLLGDIKSVSVSGENEFIFSTTMNFVGKSSTFSFVTENNYVPTLPPEINSVCNAITNKQTFFYKDYKNYESVEEISDKSKIIFLENADENFSYVLWGNKVGYVKTSDVTKTEDAWNGDSVLRVMLQKTRLYYFPSQEKSEYITVENGTKLIIVGEGYQNEQNWYKVQYDGKKYYVIVAGLAFDSEQALTNEKAAYGRAKSSKVGTKVALYSLPDEKSTLITNIIDGKELTIIGEEINGFYKVKIGTQTGYVKTENLKWGGLTNVQIISITCAAVAIVAGIIILIVTTKLKKKKDLSNKTDDGSNTIRKI